MMLTVALYAVGTRNETADHRRSEFLLAVYILLAVSEPTNVAIDNPFLVPFEVLSDCINVNV